MACKSETGLGTRALVKELTDAFQFFDLNGDGKLSVQEMTKVVRSLSEEQVAEDDLVALIRGVDGDGDGYLNLQEFIDLNSRAGADSPRAENDALVAAFNKFDEDRDGFISAEELHRVLMGFGADTYSLEECRAMISGVDTNGDHLVSLKEFQALMVFNDAPPDELHATTTCCWSTTPIVNVTSSATRTSPLSLAALESIRFDPLADAPGFQRSCMPYEESCERPK